MHWIDALAEMKKNPGKVFEFPNHKNPQKKWKVRFMEGTLKFIGPANYLWHCADIAKQDQEQDWVEVSQWKKVDYAEFMEWYCNPVNINKTCKVAYRSGVSSVSCDMLNNMRQSAYWFSTECVSFEIPNE